VCRERRSLKTRELAPAANCLGKGASPAADTAVSRGGGDRRPKPPPPHRNLHRRAIDSARASSDTRLPPHRGAVDAGARGSGGHPHLGRASGRQHDRGAPDRLEHAEVGWRIPLGVHASGSAMIAYAWAKGSRLGMLEPRYGQLARQSFDGLVAELVDWDAAAGRMRLRNVCRSAGLGGDLPRRHLRVLRLGRRRRRRRARRRRVPAGERRNRVVAPLDQASRVTSRAALSARRPMSRAWRSLPWTVHSMKAT
jgi:hypothetical protein